MKNLNIESGLITEIENSGVEESTAVMLKDKFLKFFEQAEEWKEKAEAIRVTDASQKHDMQLARTARLALREIRINADKTRKALKEDSLRYGKAVQGVYNIIEYLIAPIEKHLEEQERFVEIQAAKERAEKEEQERQERERAEAARMAAEEKARQEAAEKQRIENDRIRAENERLQKEAAVREAEMQKEREAASKIQAEKDAELKRVQDEANAARLKAEQAEREEQERIAALAAAPDNEKLEALRLQIYNIGIPDFTTEKAKKTGQQVLQLLAKVANFIEENKA